LCWRRHHPRAVVAEWRDGVRPGVRELWLDGLVVGGLLPETLNPEFAGWYKLPTKPTTTFRRVLHPNLTEAAVLEELEHAMAADAAHRLAPPLFQP
jgi:hypothetical protein